MKEFKSKPLIGLDDLSDNKFTLQKLSQSEVGKVTGKIIGMKNAESGHMNKIQKMGCSLGGKVGGVITRDSGKLKEYGILGNQSNAEKYGVRIYATNLNTEEVWEYISIREAERDLKIQAPIIRKILRGLQPKTRCGWTFEYKNID
jgi:hypothetical protein